MFDLRELASPVVGAPMAGGGSTPALAAAVSEAGGLGFLAAGYLSAERVASDLEEVRATTSAPVGVNLFVVKPYEPDAAAIRAYAERLAPEASRLGVALGRPRWDDDSWAGKLSVLLDLRPAVASFTFGCPTAEVLRSLHEAGVATVVTVTTVAEAKEAVARGAASLSVQGDDAGGHRGTWDPEAAPATTPLPELVRAVVSAVAVPVVAGGGVADAHDVEDLLANGALAAQVGTAFLRSDEAGTNPLHEAALTSPDLPSTALTRSFTGRWARGLANRFMADHADAPCGYPHLHHLTAPLRAAAVAAGDTQVAHLWAGTGHASARALPARDITRLLTP